MEIFSFLAAPMVLSILLVGIHSYLGLHVLEREVIFVDISLAQVAALGSSLCFLFFQDQHEHGVVPHLFSLGLCLIVASLLALLRYFERRLSQEVLIGITYAFASGLLILVLDRLPHGTEHLKEALIGNILLVTWPKVLVVGVVYMTIGMIHYIFRRKFWASSRGEIRSIPWDMLFYFLFGIVITFSTHHAGVLVVFSILVIPAAIASRLSVSPLFRIFLAWLVGMLGILGAFLLSYQLDLPAGATIVSLLGAIFFLILAGCILFEKFVLQKQQLTR